MRCLTLGAELRRRFWSVTLLTAEIDKFLELRADRLGIRVVPLTAPIGSVEDADQTAAVGADLVVVDGYDFTDDFFADLDRRSVPYVVLDDNGNTAPSGARAIVNQNPHADHALYPTVATGRLFAGPKYALIRDEIRALRGSGSPSLHAGVPSVLVSIGGTDVLGLSGEVATSMARRGGLRVVASLEAPVDGVDRAPKDIAAPLANATVAVIGAGGTLWEACCLGVPSVALVVADNQVAPSGRAKALGVCELIDCRAGIDVDQVSRAVGALLADPARRATMSKAGSRLIDGKGVDRVADAAERIVEKA